MAIRVLLPSSLDSEGVVVEIGSIYESNTLQLEDVVAISAIPEEGSRSKKETEGFWPVGRPG